MVRLLGFTAVVVATCASLPACKNSDRGFVGGNSAASGSPGAGFNSPPPVPQQSNPGGQARGFDKSALIGTWMTPCTNAEDNSTSGVTTATFTDTTLMLSTLAYQSGNCQNQPSQPITQTFNYSLGNVSSVADATMEYDLTEVVGTYTYPKRYSILQIKGNTLIVGQPDAQGDNNGSTPDKRFRILGSLSYTKK